MDLSGEQRQRVREIARKHGLDLILLFGSALTGKMHPRSDLDIAVQFEDGEWGFGRFADVLHDLQGIFPGREVDLAVINRADPLFLKKITESCQLLLGDARRLMALKTYAFKRYQDHKRFFEMERSYVTRFLEEMGLRS